MIKLETIATYYNKSNLLRQIKIASNTFYNLSDALDVFRKAIPRYYINKKDISVIETIALTYKIDLGYKRLYKTIDPLTENIETNYKED